MRLPLRCGPHAPYLFLMNSLTWLGEVVEEDESRAETGIIDEFRDFIENISPEDFDT